MTTEVFREVSASTSSDEGEEASGVLPSDASVLDNIQSRHVTTRDPRKSVGELTSMLHSLYLDEDAPADEQGPDVAALFDSLNAHIDAVEERQKEAIDSTLCREEGLRASIDGLSDTLKDYINDKLQAMDEAIVACLKKRDAKWQEELKRCMDKTRLSWRPAVYSTPALPGSVTDVSSAPQPGPRKAANSSRVP